MMDLKSYSIALLTLSRLCPVEKGLSVPLRSRGGRGQARGQTVGQAPSEPKAISKGKVVNCARHQITPCLFYLCVRFGRSQSASSLLFSLFVTYCLHIIVVIVEALCGGAGDAGDLLTFPGWCDPAIPRRSCAWRQSAVSHQTFVTET